MQKVTLQEMTIQKIIADYPDDILLKFKDLINERLRNGSIAEIIVALDPYFGGYVINGQNRIEAMRLFLRFLLEILHELDFPTENILAKSKKEMCQRLMQSEVYKRIPKFWFDIGVNRSYGDYINSFLNALEVNDELEPFYIHGICIPIFESFKYGFDVKESHQILKIYQQFVSQLTDLPHDLDISKLLITVECKQNDYILIIKDVENADYIAHTFQNINDFDVYKECDNKPFKIHQIE